MKINKARCKDTGNLFGKGVESLEPGNVPEEYLTLLFELLKSAESPVRTAVFDHLCSGKLQSTAAEERGVRQGSISRQVRRLQQVNATVSQLAKFHQ